MDNLWAAWRRDFILGPKEKGCVFCTRIRQRADRRNLIVYRGKRNIIIMNKYPYNAGHLLVVPKAHTGKLGLLTSAESNEMFELARRSVEVLEEAMPASGFNIGLNIGSDAGAGINDHVHVHIVPRFKGDTNFMTAVGEVKVQSISIVDIYDMIKPGFDQLGNKS